MQGRPLLLRDKGGEKERSHFRHRNAFHFNGATRETWAIKGAEPLDAIHGARKEPRCRFGFGSPLRDVHASYIRIDFMAVVFFISYHTIIRSHACDFRGRKANYCTVDPQERYAFKGEHPTSIAKLLSFRPGGSFFVVKIST